VERAGAFCPGSCYALFTNVLEGAFSEVRRTKFLKHSRYLYC
jgi:hypothetical protein